MKKLLLFLIALPSVISFSQSTTENRLIGITAGGEITFYTEDYTDFENNYLGVDVGYAIALNPGDSLLYALIDEDYSGNRNLYQVNPFTAEIELVFEFDVSHFNSADIGADGMVYLITGNGGDIPGQIYTLNSATLDFELLFETGLEGPYGIEFNSSNNSLYIFKGDDFEEHFVHRLDLETMDFTEMPLDGVEEVELHGAYYIEDDNKFLLTDYYGDIRETVSDEYNATEPFFTSDDFSIMDLCHIQTLRTEGWDIEFEACPGDDSTKIELLYEVNDVAWYRDGELIEGADESVYYAKTSGDFQALMQIGDTENYMWSETVSVSFYSSPVVTISQEEDDHFMCPDETILLEGAVPGGGSVQWMLNGELIDDATGGSYLAEGPGVYNQIKTNLPGCSDTAAVSFIIEAVDLPEVTLTVEDEFICPDEVVTITGISDTEVQWYLNGEPIDGETGEIIDVTEAGVYNQYVVNEFGCADSALVGITITPADNPTVEISTEDEDMTICEGDEIVLEGSEGEELMWYLNGEPIDGATDPFLSTDMAGIYNLVVTNEFGCSDSAEVGIEVMVSEYPTVDLFTEAEDLILCPEETILLEGTEGPENQWYFNGEPIDGATDATYEINMAGVYNLMLINEFGCADSAATGIVIEEGEAPVVEISNEDDDHLICPDETIVLEGSTGDMLQWYMDGEPIDGETGDTYDATEAGTYNLMITNEMGCSSFADDDYVIDVDPDCGVGIAENTQINLDIYPNPVTDFLTISAELKLNAVVIYDLSGHVVYQLNEINSNIVTVNFDEFSAGLYLVQIITEAGTKTVKAEKN